MIFVIVVVLQWIYTVVSVWEGKNNVWLRLENTFLRVFLCVPASSFFAQKGFGGHDSEINSGLELKLDWGEEESVSFYIFTLLL